jgi:hypothetical protein
MNLSTVFIFKGLTLLLPISIIFNNYIVEGVLRCLAVEKENDIKLRHIKEKRNSEKTDIKRNN